MTYARLLEILRLEFLALISDGRKTEALAVWLSREHLEAVALALPEDRRTLPDAPPPTGQGVERG